MAAHLGTPVLAVLALNVLAPPALAGETVQERLAAVPESSYASSIVSLEPRVVELDSRVRPLSRSIEPVDSRLVEGGASVISLKSDVLFDFDKADLPSGADTALAEMVEKIPRGAAARVHGHTDSIGEEGRNLALSQRRAEAVAAAIRAARPDLRLEVKGFGETRPVRPNTRDGQDDPEGRAANRRVEIRFAG